MTASTRRRFLAGGAVAVGAAAGVGLWQGPVGSGGRGGRHRCPDLGWLRVRGLMLPVAAIDLLETPPLPGIPPIETLAALTATTRTTLLLIFAGLPDPVGLVDDIEAQLRLLRLRLQR